MANGLSPSCCVSGSQDGETHSAQRANPTTLKSECLVWYLWLGVQKLDHEIHSYADPNFFPFLVVALGFLAICSALFFEECQHVQKSRNITQLRLKLAPARAEWSSAHPSEEPRQQNPEDVSIFQLRPKSQITQCRKLLLAEEAVMCGYGRSWISEPSKGKSWQRRR